jgi:hypothetical protein
VEMVTCSWGNDVVVGKCGLGRDRWRVGS